MKAVVKLADGTLEFADVEEPAPAPDEALVQVQAISLNRGEVRKGHGRSRPGWDFAGVVVKSAAGDRGPAIGKRVVGLSMRGGAWAELIAAPIRSLAPIPDSIASEIAACLPVAGLTALHALARRGELIGRRVLVTGASGSVGSFACQLGRVAGARIVGLARHSDQEPVIRAAGAEEVVLAPSTAEADRFGPYDLILESLGGDSVKASARMLAPDGICVIYGMTAERQATFDVEDFYLKGGASLLGFNLFHELESREDASIGLGRLLALIDRGVLAPRIASVRPWTDIADCAARLASGALAGKAVLTL